MIILDTNIISDAARTRPDTNVQTWMAVQQRRSLFTTSISQAEMFFGIGSLPAGSRRHELERVAKEIFFEELAGRILPFDSDAAEIYARISAERRSIGKPIRELDAQIASIALLHRAILATRNVRDFEHLGLDIINPWDFGA